MDFFKPPQAKAQGGFTFDVEHNINFAKNKHPTIDLTEKSTCEFDFAENVTSI